MNYEIKYWIKCNRDSTPRLLRVTTMEDLLNEIQRLVIERGPIEFMIQY